MPEWLWWVIVLGVGIPLLGLLVWLNDIKDKTDSGEEAP